MQFALVLNIVCRSGAVEQLRVHVRNLSMLGVNGATNSKGRVELYEKGYGRDAAGIAKEAIAYGMGCLFSFWVHSNAELHQVKITTLTLS